MRRRAIRDFEVGEIVEWSSQAHGRERTKRGKISHIVEANMPPPLEYRDRGTSPRTERSYVVHGGIIDSDRKDYYWPQAFRLRPVKKDVKAGDERPTMLHVPVTGTNGDVEVILLPNDQVEVRAEAMHGRGVVLDVGQVKALRDALIHIAYRLDPWENRDAE